jgi:uncharacterized protein (DUF983 family)
VACGTMKNVDVTHNVSQSAMHSDSLALDTVSPPAFDAPRRIGAAMWTGAKCRCPACGRGKLYRGYLKVVDACSSCGTELHHQRADDAPPYFTMFIVGHIVIGGLLAVEKKFAPDTMTQLLIWLPLACILSLALLPVIKGALIGQQWALRLHGFGLGPDPSGPDPAPSPAVVRANTDKGDSV